MQTRRTFLAGAGVSAAVIGSGALAASTGPSSPTAGTRGVQAVTFDIFTIFDIRQLDAVAEEQFPGQGKDVSAAWKDKLFQYCWLHTLDGRYVDFHQVNVEALRFVCTAKGITAKPESIEALANVFSHLKIWPDSAEALRRMHTAGLRLAFLSNLTDAMLKSSSEGAGIADLFEQRLSTDRVQAYKPDPRAYAMAEKALRLKRSQVVFAAAGGWDYTGAKAFGLNTYWVNRAGAQHENLNLEADGEGRSLTELAEYALARMA